MPDLIHLWHKARGIYNRTSIAAPQRLSGKRGRGGEQLAAAFAKATAGQGSSWQ